MTRVDFIYFSHKIAAEREEESPDPSVCQADMVYAEDCSLGVRSSAQNSVHLIEVEELPSPKHRAQSIGLGQRMGHSSVSPQLKFCYN